MSSAAAEAPIFVDRWAVLTEVHAHQLIEAIERSGQAALDVYADGGCAPNPGPGGWGLAIYAGCKPLLELFGGEADTTNNRMELTAALAALKVCPAGIVITIHTDSQYVCNGITTWINNWKRKSWRTGDKKPVKNRELWEHLDAANAVRRPRWQWVRGHNGNAGNERADELAGMGIRAAGMCRPRAAGAAVASTMAGLPLLAADPTTAAVQGDLYKGASPLISEAAIDAASRHIYEEKSDRKGVGSVGWENEPEEVREGWRSDVRSSVAAYLRARGAQRIR
jgi:ribonuclease HI